MNLQSVPNVSHPVLTRGVYVAPIILPDGRDLAIAISSRGVLVARESFEPAEWDAVYDRLNAQLDEIDPRQQLRLA